MSTITSPNLDAVSKMSFKVIDLIKNIPPSARRILEVTDRGTGLVDIFWSRAPLAAITSLRPGDVSGDQRFDCVALFSSGVDMDVMVELFKGLPAKGQIIAAPDAIDPALLEALAEANCHIFDREPVLRAWRSGEAPPSIALHCSITPEMVNDADIRVHQPNSFLRTIPGLRPMAQVEYLSPSLSAGFESRILLMHRSILHPGRDRSFLKKVIAGGYLIVLDLDDDPDYFPGLFENDAFALRCLHAAQVSTPGIADRLREYVSEIAILPNHLPVLPPVRIKTEPITRVFIGAYNRSEDWAEISNQANRVLGYFGESVQIEVLHDRRVFDGLVAPNKRFTPRCSYSLYLELLGSCDIALLPLRDTAFNRCKSDLKFVQCAAYGVAALAPMPVYANSVEDGQTGVLYRSPSEFMTGLQRLIQEPELRDHLTAQARDSAMNKRMLADHYEGRHAWYLDLIGKCPALCADHRVKVPELYD